jgi:hypothetical protein
MKKYLPILELEMAISKGYVHDFEILSTGTLRCLTDSTNYCYELSEVTLTCIPIKSIPRGNLFLISAPNGLKGTIIDYVESIY